MFTRTITDDKEMLRGHTPSSLVASLCYPDSVEATGPGTRGNLEQFQKPSNLW